MVSTPETWCFILVLTEASQPIHAAWDMATGFEPYRCINEDRFFIGSGSANVGLNIIVFVLVCPLPTLFGRIAL